MTTSKQLNNILSTSKLDPNVLPDFDNMPNVALMDTSHVDKSQPPFILVDGSYYLFRTYHALPDMTTTKGLHTNAIKGTLNALHKLIRRYQPTHMVVAFDTKSPTFRHQMSTDYKANRPPMDPELSQQIPYIHKLIQALGIPLVRIEGAEADDIIGTLAYRACQQGHHVVISTGDKDMAQLVNNAIVLEDSFKSQVTDIDGVYEKFEVTPEQIIDYLTLMGDSSDGIKGVPKVGKKTAVKLLKEYQNLDNILSNASNIKGVVGKNLIEYAENTVKDKQLATIITNLDLLGELGLNWDNLRINTDPVAHINELRSLYTELEFRSELDSLDHPNHPANAYQQDYQTNSIQDSQTNSEKQAQAYKSIQSTQNKKDIQKSSDLKKQWHTVFEKSEFDRLIERLNKSTCFAIDTETTDLNWKKADIVGISISFTQHEAYYIPIAHGLDKLEQLGGLDLNLDTESEDSLDPMAFKQLKQETVLQALKPILENPNIGKIGQHLKYDSHIFSKYDIELINWQCDTMLASYVINASATLHNMDSLARHYLHTQTIKYEDIAGKGSKQVTFDKININIASDYACEDVDITYQLFEKFNEFFNDPESGDHGNNLLLLNKIEIPTAKILTKMEENGILINRKFLKKLSQRFDQEINDLEKEAHNIAGEEFNVSSPKQLGEILFDKLKLKGGKKTRSGQYSTSEAVLAKIDHPLVDLVQEYRSLSKLKSTYTDALDKVADSSTDRVHTSYHQALTSTGRLSSTDPNLQNIPIRTKTGRLIRQAFIAPADRIIMAADYSQIELRLMAHFSGDETLINAFNEGLDIHSATAAEVLNKPIVAVTKEERRNAKAVNFGLLYGMTEYGLAKQLGITAKEAKEYIGKYFSRYPNVNSFMQNTQNNAQYNGYVRTILNRRLYTPDINNSKYMIKQAAIRAAINAPLQGSAADIIKLAMIAVEEQLRATGHDQHAKMLLQVHDELVFEVDKDKVDEIGKLIKESMQNVLTHTAQSLGWEVDFAVPLVVEIDCGNNWDEAH